MNTIIFQGQEVTPAPILEGFQVKETPASNYISAIATNPTTEELYIMFRNGARSEPGSQPPVFFYSPISAILLEGLKTADSVGKFYHANIKNSYKGQQIFTKLFEPVRKPKE